jgi:flagellar motility protein MotE (MotC chaperone)
MMRFIRDLRLIPIALIASACLLVLKTADLLLDGGRWLESDNTPAVEGGASVIRTSPDAPQPPGMKLSWAQQMFDFPNGAGASRTADFAPTAADRARADRSNTDITGSITTSTVQGPGPGQAAAREGANGATGAAGKPTNPAASPDGRVIPTDGAALPSGAERAILERLQERRQELDTRARELDIRESLLKAAEKRIDAQLAELKQVEARITTETAQKDEAEAGRFKSLVTMYENMKPRDAAKIFDRLETNVLIQVASKINPRQMSEILAQMSPEVAERLTVELASKAQAAPSSAAAGLPKIEGKPTTP